MSLLDALIFGIRKLWVNGTEQPLKSQIELRGDGVSVSQSGDKHIIDIAAGGGGGYSDAPYLLHAADSRLTNNKVVVGSSSIALTSAGGNLALSCTFGTGSGTVCQGNDSRLSDARTPTAHAASHKHGGSDEVATATAAANAIPKAGAGGTLAIGWLPTGTTSSTVCIGNDARLSTSTPTEGTTGQVLVVSGSTVKPAGRTGKWWNCNSTPSVHAASSSSVTVAGLNVKPGEPVRVLTLSSRVYASSNFPKVKSTSFTTIKGSNLDYRLCAHAQSVLVSGTTFRFDIFTDETCVTQIGSTATFDANVTADTGPLTITATNGSGIVGTLIASCSTEDKTAGKVSRLSFATTGICTSYNASTGVLAIAGQAISTVPGDILEVWLGSPSLVVSIPFAIPGYYSVTTSQALKDRTSAPLFWDLPNGTVCQLKVMHGKADAATQPKVALVVDGNQLVADGSALALSATADTRTSTVVEMTAAQMVVSDGSKIELRVIAGTNTDPARDLSGVIRGVLD